MVLCSFLALYLCLKSPGNILGQITPSSGSQTPQILNFITSVGSEHLNFPKLHSLEVQNYYVKMPSVF